MSEPNNTSDTTTVIEPVPVTEPAASASSEPATSTSARPAAGPLPKPTQRRSAFGILLNTLLLVAVAGLGYGFWQQKTTLEDLAAEHAALAGQVASSSGQFTSLQNSQQQITDNFQSMQQQIDQALDQQMQNQQQAQQQLQSQLGESNSRIAGLAAQLNAMNGELATTRQQVSQLGSQTADNVMLSEAEALVDLARQRLLTARDVKAATTLLIGSDDLLARIASIDVTAARTVLAADLTNLKAVPDLNVETLYQQLAEVRTMVNGMTVISGSDNPEFAVPESDAAEPEETGWFDNALAALGEYFVVTRQDVEVTPLLTEEQQFLLRQNIELQLASAQLALLNTEPEVYRAALAAAREGVSQWLQGPDDSKAGILATLERLQQTPILLDLPDISASLAAIRQIASIAPVPSPAAAEDIQ
jgi:uroporphyrin-3 C-methyltransferase